jgi:hypothetical protein
MLPFEKLSKIAKRDQPMEAAFFTIRPHDLL